MNAAKITGIPPEEANQKTIAIMQMTRLGDIIQTYQAALELKTEHPEIRLVLIARKKFATPLNFLLKKVFSAVYSLDFPHMLSKGENLSSLKNEVASFISAISAENINVLVNLSFSKSSAYLATLIRADNKLGMSYRENNQVNIPDRWSQYIYSNVMGSNYNAFNLVDIFKNILGVKGTKSLALMQATKPSQHVVIHPFASLAKKRWRGNKWVEVLQKVLRDNDKVRITLVGDKSESVAAEQIRTAPVLEAYKSRIENMAGKLSIEETYNLFDNQTIFVERDSMVGHLAALRGARIVTVSLGTVRPSETTPYIAGAYNIAPRSKCFPCFPHDGCDLHQCHADIPYQVVAAAMELMIAGKDITAKNIEEATSLFHLSSVNILQTTFTNASLFDVQNILNHEAMVSDIFRKIYRVTWLYVLTQTEENQKLPQMSSNGHKELLQRMEGLEQLFELCEFGKKYSRYILEEISAPVPRITALKDFSKRIDEIDALQNTLKAKHPQLAPIIDHFAVVKGNLLGENLVELTENSYLAFEDSKMVTNVVYDLIEKVIAEYKLKSAVGKSYKEEYHR